jgi:hypothetical protein
MPIGTSLGAYFDDSFHHATAQWDEKYDDNVITPDQSNTNKQLNQSELDPSTGTGIEVGLKKVYIYGDTPSTMPLGSPTEPAGAFNGESATPVAPQENASPEPPESPGIMDKLLGTNGAERYQTWPEKAVRSTLDALRLPGDVMSGEVNVDSAQGIERAFNLASTMVFGPAPIAGKAVDGTLGSFAGVSSKTIDQKARFRAVTMEAKGATPDEIYKETGFFKGSDGRIRYEIPDEGMKLANRDWRFGETGKLSDFVEHPELFKAYPELKDIQFKVADKDYPYIGSFNTASNQLTVNPRLIRSGDEGVLDVISHELQHVIQKKEGFTNGTNPTVALDKALEALKSKITGNHYDDTKERLLNLYMDIKMNAEKFADYMYERTPGEVEANTVMARRKLDAALRKEFSPAETMKLLEGHPNAISGGTHRPEFIYPK